MPSRLEHGRSSDCRAGDDHGDPPGVLFLPIAGNLLIGDGVLYSWDQESGFREANHLPLEAWTEKSRLAESGLVHVRAMIYFAIWSALAIYYFPWQRRNRTKRATRRSPIGLQWWSGPAVMAFCGATSFAAFDWVMSLAPMWFSTMFGVYIFAGSVLSAHCAIAVGSYVLQKQGAMRDEVTIEHYHDLGKADLWIHLFLDLHRIQPIHADLVWQHSGRNRVVLSPPDTGIWGTLALSPDFLPLDAAVCGTMSRHVRRNPRWCSVGPSTF